MTKKTPDRVQQEWRTEAERRLGHRTPLTLQATWDTSDLTHELHVHHIEIELQNEELQRTVAELDVERQQYHTLYEHAPSAYLTLNEHGDVLNVNQAGVRLLRVQKGQLLMRRFGQFIAPQQRGAFDEALRSKVIQAALPHLFTLEHRSGERTDVHLQLLTLPASAQVQPRYLITLMDITPLAQTRAHLEHLIATLEDRVQESTRELLDLNARLLHQVRHDFLTGLPNRSAFSEELHQSLQGLREHRRAFAVLFFDVDRFKLINDSLGHVAGDQVLVELAKRLLAVTRPADHVSRLGGDEFAMLLQDVTDLGTVSGVIARLEAAVQKPFLLDQQELHLMISTGILLVQGGYTSAEEVLRDVDVALYQAKRGGRAVSRVFEPSMRDEFSGRLELEAQLRHALERQELVVHYQPIVALATGQVLGLEALVRWRHPQRGLLLPGAFIPLAEELDLVGQIDGWVMREAARQAAGWQTGSPETGNSENGNSEAGQTDHARLWMTVNVSAQNLEQIRLVTAPLIDQPFPEPWQVQIEITERVLTHTEESDPASLEALRLAQVGLVLDDFGVGFSSLSALYRFPVRMLKIDRSFVAALDENLDLVRAIVRIGEALGLTVVAEGVETAAQQRSLLDLGITVAQGWLFAAVLPPDDALAYVRAHRGP